MVASPHSVRALTSSRSPSRGTATGGAVSGARVRRRDLGAADVRAVRGLNVTELALTVVEASVRRRGGANLLDRALRGLREFLLAARPRCGGRTGAGKDRGTDAPDNARTCTPAPAASRSRSRSRRRRVWWRSSCAERLLVKRHRGCVHDVTGVLPDHDRIDRLDAVCHTAQVRVEDVVPVVERVRVDFTDDSDAALLNR